MGLFDGLKSAFANDDTLGERENAGLSKVKDKRTVTWVSPKGQQKKVRPDPVECCWSALRPLHDTAECSPLSRLHCLRCLYLYLLCLCCQALAIGGQRMKDIARASGIPIVYDCQEGSCKTCEATVNGQRMKLCVGKMVRRRHSHFARMRERERGR